jgi:hypothetical protein
MRQGGWMMTDHAQKSEKKGGLDQVKKWLGLGAALLSLASAAVGLLHAQATRKARVTEASQLMASGRLQEKAGDYEHAWDNFQKAAKLTAEDGLIARFIFGRLTKQEAEVHDALEELAEKWVRDARASDEQGLADIGDKAIKMLSADVTGATGEHKADLLAHIGYAYFLKDRNAEEGALQPVTFYQEAVAADPHNPYANAFWGHLILFNHGSIAEAKQHFADALASNREHELVRHLELAGFANDEGLDEAESAWLQVVNEMHKAGEPVTAHDAQELASRYYLASSNENERKALYAAVPPAEQAELARWLLHSGNVESNGLAVKVMLAYSLEAAGSKAEALAAWQDVETTVKGDATIYNTVTREAIKRLGGGVAGGSR